LTALCSAQAWLHSLASLAILLTALGACGITQVALQAALLAEVSVMPLAYTQAVVAGCATSGTSLLFVLLHVKGPRVYAGPWWKASAGAASPSADVLRLHAALLVPGIAPY
jgi:hypothetical protein